MLKDFVIVISSLVVYIEEYISTDMQRCLTGFPLQSLYPNVAETSFESCSS